MKKERENLVNSIKITFETLLQELSKFDQERQIKFHQLVSICLTVAFWYFI